MYCQFPLSRSRGLSQAVFAGHMLALGSLALWPGPPPVALLLATGVLLSLVVALRRPWPVRLRLRRTGSWEMVRSDGLVVRGRIRDGRILRNVISITLSGRGGYTMLLLPDTFRDGDHTRIRALLRHRCADPAC